MTEEQKITYAPVLDELVAAASRYPAVNGASHRKLVYALFKRLSAVRGESGKVGEKKMDPISGIEDSGDSAELTGKAASSAKSEKQSVWLHFPRGPLEAWTNYRSLDRTAACERFADWNNRYPGDECWYQLTGGYENGVYFLHLDGVLVCTLDEAIPAGSGRRPASDAPLKLIMALIGWIDRAILEIESGKYAQILADSLPFQKRAGRIQRRKYWTLVPSEKAKTLKDLRAHEIKTFCRRMKEEHLDMNKRIDNMTAGMFFECCRIGYGAIGLADTDIMSSRELYRLYGNNAGDGILNIDEASCEQFTRWFREKGGVNSAAWNVMSGSMRMRVKHDKRGWCLYLSAWHPFADAVRFYMALVRDGKPVFFGLGHDMARAVLGDDYLGIVPNDLNFHNAHTMIPFSETEAIVDYLHLPVNRPETVEIIGAAEWYPPDRQLS